MISVQKWAEITNFSGNILLGKLLVNWPLMEKGLAIFLRKGGLPLRLLIFVQSISRVTHMHGNNLFSTFSERPEGE